MITKTSLSTVEKYNDLFDLADTILTKCYEILSSVTEIEDDDITKNSDDSYSIRVDNTFYTISEDTLNELTTFFGLGEEDAQPGNPQIIDSAEGEITIKTLEDYFSIIGALGQIHPRFERLPLTEEMFRIDANTRSIIPPSGNQVYAVKGDNVAETIYFNIDRYFDAVDLGSEDIKIIINCTINGKSFIVNIDSIDVDSDPGNIIFGWPITKELTANSGTIQYAVRFYCSDNTNNWYSFNTLPQTLTIRDSALLVGDPIAVSPAPFRRNFAPKGTLDFNPPVFDTENSTPLISTQIQQLTDSNNIFTVYATSATPGSQINEYSFSKTLNSETIPKNFINASRYENKGTISQGINDEILTTATMGKYYIKNGDIYNPITAEDLDPTSTENYYEKFEGAECTMDEPGTYVCTVIAALNIFEKTASYGPIQVMAPGYRKFSSNTNGFKINDTDKEIKLLNFTDNNEKTNLSDYTVLSSITEVDDINTTEYYSNSDFYETSSQSLSTVTLTKKSDDKWYLTSELNGGTLTSGIGYTIVPIEDSTLPESAEISVSPTSELSISNIPDASYGWVRSYQWFKDLNLIGQEPTYKIINGPTAGDKYTCTITDTLDLDINTKISDNSTKTLNVEKTFQVS